MRWCPSSNLSRHFYEQYFFPKVLTWPLVGLRELRRARPQFFLYQLERGRGGERFFWEGRGEWLPKQLGRRDRVGSWKPTLASPLLYSLPWPGVKKFWLFCVSPSARFSTPTKQGTLDRRFGKISGVRRKIGGGGFGKILAAAPLLHPESKRKKRNVFVKKEKPWHCFRRMTKQSVSLPIRRPVISATDAEFP